MEILSLHPIQIQILAQLMRAQKALRYSELMIPGIENDLFNYHLQILVKKDYILKKDLLYELALPGKDVVSKLDALGNQREYFKVSVALAVFRNNYTEKLFQERKRNPFYGDITGIAGKVIQGEKVVDAARRKLQEEAGLSGIFKNIGAFRKIRRNAEGKILADTFYFYCVTEDPVGILVEENAFGRQFWGPKKDILKYEKTNVDCSEQDIEIWKRILAKDFSPFYYESDFTVKSY